MHLRPATVAPRASRGAEHLVERDAQRGAAHRVEPLGELARRAARRVLLPGARVVDDLPGIEVRAASTAKRRTSAAEIEKLPAAITPTPFARAVRRPRRSRPRQAARADDDPTPRSSAARTLASRRGVGVVDENVRRRPRRAPPRPTRTARYRSATTPETSSRSSAARTPSATALPVQPVIPATQTRITSVGILRRAVFGERVPRAQDEQLDRVGEVLLRDVVVPPLDPKPVGLEQHIGVR